MSEYTVVARLRRRSSLREAIDRACSLRLGDDLAVEVVRDGLTVWTLDEGLTDDELEVWRDEQSEQGHASRVCLALEALYGSRAARRRVLDIILSEETD